MSSLGQSSHRHELWRLVMVGQSMSGKRTMAQGLLHAAGAARCAVAVAQTTDIGGNHKGDKTNALAEESYRRVLMHGAGLAHAFISGRVDTAGDFPTADTSMELFVIDHPSALCVAVPSLDTIHRTLILFVVDLAVPETVEEQLEYWRSHIYKHVEHMCAGSTALSALINDAKVRTEQGRSSLEATAIISALRTEFSSITGTPPTSSTPPMPPASDMCPIKGFVVANKLDVLEKHSHTAGGAKSTVYDKKLSRAQFVLHLLRLKAIRQCSGFVQMSATHLSPQMYKALLSFIEHDFCARARHTEDDSAADASEVEVPSTPMSALTVLNGAQPAGALLTASARVLPIGCDNETLIHPFVRTNSLDAKRSLFQHQEDTGKPSDGVVDGGSHEKLLSDMEAAMEETPVWDMM